MRPPRRSVLMLLVVAGALPGCAARRARLMGGDLAATPPATPPHVVARPGGSGYASFGGKAQLRTDSPSLSTLEAEARAREPAPYEEVPYGAAGPEGEVGVGSYYDPWAGGANWGVVPPGYLYPGGAVPPGLRTPSPLTQPYHRAFPNSDVTYHRPGLSTGSGVHGREATDPQRWPQLAKPTR